ncbi:hypothetical protein MMC29_004953 [Sticta canariensis]|nr:hypothetical protein [Sticta canariensis]
MVKAVGAYPLDGCYNDTLNPHALNATTYTNSTSMSVEACVGYCITKNYDVAGLENGQSCYCSSTLPPSVASVDVAQCNMLCTGNQREFCGSYDKLLVYKKDPSSVNTNGVPAVVNQDNSAIIPRAQINPTQVRDHLVRGWLIRRDTRQLFIVASRLSESGTKKVLLLEGGGPSYFVIGGTDNPSQDGFRYLQSGYTVAKKWLVTNAGYSELKINANAAKKTKVLGHPAYNDYNAQRSGPVVNYLQAALKRSNFGLQRRGRVVMSGGALKSPELLMKSGIGDPAVLTRLHDAKKLGGLPVTSWINSAAVGAGLFDNPNTFIELSSPDIESYIYSYDNPPAADKALYLQHRSGPCSFAGQTSVFWDYVKRADGTLAGMQGTVGSAGFRDYTSNQTVTLNIYGTSGLKSTGKARRETSITDHPQDEQDIATFIHGIFAALPGSSLTSLNIPQSATYQQIVEYITTWSAYARGQVNHWSSSCRIGSCVDANTTVLGTKNIHVVGGSIVAPFDRQPADGNYDCEGVSFGVDWKSVIENVSDTGIYPEENLGNGTQSLSTPFCRTVLQSASSQLHETGEKNTFIDQNIVRPINRQL